MKREILKPGVLILLICVLCGGCKKGKTGMEDFNIKMITPENIHGVMAPDDQHIWITGNQGIIFHSSDGGQTWNEQESGVRTLLCDGIFLNSRTGWIAGLYGNILHTGDGGATWVKQNSGTARHLFSLSFVDENNGWAVGEWNTILRTADGGRTWERMTEEEDRIYSNVEFVDKNSGWAVGEAGIIMHTSDGGGTWERQMPEAFERATFEEEYENPRPALFGTFFTDSKTGYICGLEATILKTTDAGRTWNKTNTETQYPIYSVFMKDGKGWAVGDKGAYLMSEDNGATWRYRSGLIKSKQWYRDVYFSSPEKGWVVGQSGIVVNSTDGGETWEFLSGMSYAMKFFEMPKALEFKGMPDFGPFKKE